jgi:stage II sporulation protein AB (anti-sigma F factor)
MTFSNKMEITFDAQSVNEGFARMAVAAFVAQLNPTLEELADVRTAVSEAVTNAIIHGYESDRSKKVTISCGIDENTVYIEVSDSGVGICDIRQAMEPFYTSRPELERSGMGFAFMEAFMDDVNVASSPGEGTRVTMSKRIKG